MPQQQISTVTNCERHVRLKSARVRMDRLTYRHDRAGLSAVGYCSPSESF